MERRDFVRRSAIATVGGLSGKLPPWSGGSHDLVLRKADATDPIALASDDAFWLEVRKAYVTTPDLIDLDNANTAPSPAVVFEAYIERERKLRHAPAQGFGKMFDEADKVARPALAKYLGTTPERMAFMPNTTTAINTVLHGFPMQRGDEIIVTDHEYPDMIETILQRVKRDGIVMRVVSVPQVAEDRLALVDRVAKAIIPRTKLLLISHVSAWSGEVLPVDEVAAVARSRGVAVIVDAAQSVGILRVSFDDIGCDFLATSLHKGLGGPLAAGALIMRPEHVGKVGPLHPPSWDTTKFPMDLYEWTGTFNVAAHASITDALEFQGAIGFERKQARIRYLGDYWQDRLRGVPQVGILTPRDPSRYFGVASMMVDTVPSAALAKHLRTKGLLTQDKSGRHSPYPNALRVSPGVYATTQELDRFVAAVKDVASDPRIVTS